MILSLFRKVPLPPVYHHSAIGEIPIRVHNRAKRLTLKLDPSTGFSITATPTTSKTDIDAFMRQHENWLIKQNQKKSPIDTSTILVQGIPYAIETMDFSGRSLYKIDPVARKLFVDPTLIQDQLNIRFIFEREFRKSLPDLLKKLTAKMNLSPKKISIRDTKSRWGSCSSEGNISLSWRLMMAPADVMEYVIIHELAHLAHMNHSKSFWHLVAQHCPLYRHHIHWLKINGSRILGI